MEPKLRVILADDHALVRKALRRTIDDRATIEVISDVGDADNALAECIRLKPDVLLLDIDMPGLDCFEAARMIGLRCPETRVVFLSAYSHDRYIEQAIAVQAAGYVSKAEPPEKVLDAIRTVADGGVYYSPDVQLRIVVDEASGPRLAPGHHSRISELTRRELEVLRYIARGLSKKDIASLMHISIKTVDAHAQRLMRKLEIHDRVMLARYAIREGLAEL